MMVSEVVWWLWRCGSGGGGDGGQVQCIVLNDFECNLLSLVMMMMMVVVVLEVEVEGVVVAALVEAG